MVKIEYGVEFKLSEAPKLSRSIRIGMNNLGLDHLWIIYPGEHEYPVDEKVTVLPLSRIDRLSKFIRRVNVDT